MNPRWWRVFRVAGSVVLLATIVYFLPSGSLVAAFREVSPRVLIVSLAVFFVCHLAAALKWRMLMGRRVDLPVAKVFQAHFTGLVGNISPLGMIGGDIARAGMAISSSAQPGAIVVTSVVDRIVDTVGLLALTLIGFMWIGGRSDAGEVVLLGGLAVLAAGSVAMAAAYVLLKRSHNARLAGVRDASRLMLEQPALIVRALLLSMAIQVALLWTNAYIGADVGVGASFGAWLMAWPAAKLTAFLPVSIAGIGVRESALIVLLRPLGGAPGAVMASGLLWDAVLIVGAVGGWLGVCVIPGLRPARLRRLQTP